MADPIPTKKSSWKTTVAGIATIVGAICVAAKSLLDNDPATNPDWSVLVMAITAGAGLIAARDNGVTSEQATGQVSAPPVK